MTRRKRLMLVSHVFPPDVAGGAPRMGQFARWLPELGWDVTVITGAKSGKAAIDTAAAQLPDGVHVVEAWGPDAAVSARGSVASHGAAGVLKRVARGMMRAAVFPDRQVFWVPAAAAAGIRAARATPHDAVLATYGPGSNLLVGRAIATACGLPLVLDFRDLWSTLPMDVFASATHRALAHRLERRLVRGAAAITTVAPPMARHLADEHAIDAARTHAITNGFDPADVARAVDLRIPQDPVFRLVYAGSLHDHYDREPLWAALRSLVARGRIAPENFSVEIVGNFNPREAERAGVGSFVVAKPFRPHAEVFEALGRADALLLFETPGYYAEMGYAGKVFDYALTGKPVLAAVEADGNTGRLLTALGVGQLVTPGTPSTAADFERALDTLLERRGAMPRPVDPDAAPLCEFNRRRLTERLAAILDGVTAR